MFDNKAYDELMYKLKNFSSLGENKQRKFIKKLFQDEDFIQWFFYPKAGSYVATPNMIHELYDGFTKPKIIKAIPEVIEDIGYDKFDRSVASILYNISVVASESNAKKVDSLSKSKKNGELSDKDAKDMADKINVFNEYIALLVKCARKIVKKEAKEVAKESGMPKDVCYDCYFSVPAPKNVHKFRLGKYLNIMMDQVYAAVANQTINDFYHIKWKPFFKGIFGKENLDEVATFICLEGVHRIDRYHDEEYQRVKKCWDILTSWALNELNNTTDGVRDQMIELYLKRIEKMMSNRTMDLRVNMLKIDNDFPNLAKTIQKYADKIAAIINRERNDDNRNRIEVQDDDDD